MFRVAPAEPGQRARALEFFWSHLRPDDRAAQIGKINAAVERGEMSLDGLLIAWEQEHPVGVLLILLQSDGTAFLWPPTLASADPNGELTDALYAAARTWLDHSGARLAQCLIDPDARAERAALVRNGFPHLADLLFLKRPGALPVPDDAAVSPTGPPLTSLAFAPELQERFEQVLERTYQGSLDCPALSGTRTAAEALAGHRLAGRFDPERWRLFQAGGDDIGLLLMTEHLDQRMWEVVYLGLVPEARGRGYGRDMLREGLRRAQAAGAFEMFLAVDKANHFAIKLYESLDFAAVGVQAVHIRFGSRHS